ncbi:hypothetical protein BFRIPC_00072 (plasmid) [Peribacillus frigoritolerans]
MMLDHPKRSFVFLLLVGTATGVWKKEWVLSLLPFSEQDVQRWIELAQTAFLMALITFLVLWGVRYLFYILRIQRTYTYIQLLPHADDGSSKEDLSNLMRRIHGSKRKWFERLFKGREWFSFMIYRNTENEGTKYCFYLGAERDYLETLKFTFKTVYPRLEFFPVEELSIPSKKAVGGRLKLKSNSLKKSLPLSRYKGDQLPAVLSMMERDTWLQVGFSPNDGWNLRKAIEELESDIKSDGKASERSTFEQQELKSLKHRYSGNEVAFDCTVSMASEYHPGVRVIKSVGNTIASIVNDINQLRYKKLRRSVQWFPTSFPYRMVWTGSELANLIHLPNFKNDTMHNLSNLVIHAERGTELLPENVLSSEGGISIGHLYHPFVKDREVCVRPDSLGKHFVATGLNGSGKSSLVNKLLMSFFKEFLTKDLSPGVSFIDPAGETIVTLLNQLMKAEADGHTVNWDKVHWIALRNTEYPPAMNLLQKLPGETNQTVTDSVMRIIRENFQIAPQAERLLRNCVHSLVMDPGETHTILGVKQLINDYVFRERVISRLKTVPEAFDLVEFWRNEAPDLIEISKIPLFNRLDTFTSNPLLRRMFGQKDFGFPVRKWLDEGHIVLYDFRGLDAQVTSLIGGFLTYLYYRVADTRDENGDPLLHQFVIDEAPRLPSSILPFIIRESRKKGLSLGTLTQSLTQLTPDFRDALKEAQGNFFVCKQGKEGAKEAAETFKVTVGGKDVPMYTEARFKSLPTLVAAIRTEDTINGVSQTVQCLVEAPPLDLYFPDGQKVDFENKPARAEAKRLTHEKAKELSSKNGFHESEVDLLIQAYLKGEEYVPNEGGKVKRVRKAPITQQPKTPVHLMKTKLVAAAAEKVSEEEQGKQVSPVLQEVPEQKQAAEKQEEREEMTMAASGNRNYTKGSILQRLQQKEKEDHE